MTDEFYSEQARRFEENVGREFVNITPRQYGGTLIDAFFKTPFYSGLTYLAGVGVRHGADFFPQNGAMNVLGVATMVGAGLLFLSRQGINIWMLRDTAKHNKEVNKRRAAIGLH